MAGGHLVIGVKAVIRTVPIIPLRLVPIQRYRHFILFRTMLLNYEKKVFQARLDIAEAIITMSSHIEHQKEYIKSF